MDSTGADIRPAVQSGPGVDARTSLAGLDPDATASILGAARNIDDPPYLLRGRGKLGSLVPEGGVRAGVISTLRDVKDQFLIWIEWYRLIGIAHLFLYFDDPPRDIASICEAQEIYSGDFLSFACNGPELQAEWPSLRSWGRFAKFTDDRMCRQLLNIAHCIRRGIRATKGSPEAVDWLLHLDHDELFLPPPDGLQAHLYHLEAGSCRLCLYQNYEAVPEDHTLTPFLDVSLFKVPSGRVPKTPAGGRGLDWWANRTKAGNYFLYYDNGKSAVRIRRGDKPEFAPTSVHLLFPEEDLEELTQDRAAWTNFPEGELPELELTWMVSQPDEAVSGAKILHYPATHYDRLFRKYDHLKNFPAVRFGGGLIVPPSFHLEARDCYVEHMAEGEEVQKQKLKHLLESVAMLRTPEEIDAQLRNGSVIRLDAVRESLRLGRWAPPRPLVESMAARLQRRPTSEAMDRIKQMPAAEAELLFASSGGLMKQLDAGLDAISLRLETVGWAACTLGVPAGLIKRALEEAQKVEGKMEAGTTVVKNHVIDQRLPNAHRGDKLLWMQEQGLNGAAAAKGPAPTVALLERAMSDLGMQLDERLQRGRLGLRITEHCDGMLACYGGDGAAYGPHIDNADGDGRVDGRILTVILYLNPGWDKSCGGELAVFEPTRNDIGDADVEGKWHTVWPEAGTLVFFRADRVLHEVRPAYARRFALSMWFCGQPAA